MRQRKGTSGCTSLRSASIRSQSSSVRSDALVAYTIQSSIGLAFHCSSSTGEAPAGCFRGVDMYSAGALCRIAEAVVRRGRTQDAPGNARNASAFRRKGVRVGAAMDPAEVKFIWQVYNLGSIVAREPAPESAPGHTLFGERRLRTAFFTKVKG